MSDKTKPPRSHVNRLLAYLSKATDAAARGETVADVDVRLLRLSRAASRHTRRAGGGE